MLTKCIFCLSISFPLSCLSLNNGTWEAEILSSLDALIPLSTCYEETFFSEREPLKFFYTRHSRAANFQKMAFTRRTLFWQKNLFNLIFGNWLNSALQLHNGQVDQPYGWWEYHMGIRQVYAIDLKKVLRIIITRLRLDLQIGIFRNLDFVGADSLCSKADQWKFEENPDFRLQWERRKLRRSVARKIRSFGNFFNLITWIGVMADDD